MQSRNKDHSGVPTACQNSSDAFVGIVGKGSARKGCGKGLFGLFCPAAVLSECNSDETDGEIYLDGTRSEYCTFAVADDVG